MMITNSLEQGAKPHFTLNNGSIELLLDGHSSGAGDRSEDNPTVMCLGSNANVELNNSDVRLTLRANKNNALSDQSIYGIAMHGANSKVKLDGDIIVTLEGDAKELGFGVKDDGTKKEFGGIYGIGKQNVETSVFEQTGDRVLQFGSANQAFVSSADNGLVAPFANFTHVSVGAGSSLYLTDSQSDKFVHDDAFGTTGAVFNDVGVSAKGGSLTVAGGTDADKVGVRLSDNSTLHASKIDFTGQSTVASSGSATLSGDSVKVAADAKVNFKTLDSSQSNAINLSGLIDNDGIFSLDGSGIALSADKNQQVNLGKVETVGQKESAIYTGSGNLLIEDFKGDNKSVVITDLEKAESVVIKNNSGNLNLAASSSANDQFASAQEAANALADKFTVENSDQKDHQLIVQEGTINDAVTGTIDKNGQVTDLVFHKNTTLDAYSSVATLSAFQWRHEINSVNKRMGELRLSPNGVGAWARLYGSEQEYGAQNVTAKNHSVQVGLDTSVGNGWKVGAAFNYTDGQSTYDAGNGDNKAYGLTAYGTWMADNGQYVDLTAKYSRLDNDFTVNKMAGDYSNNAYSVSAEYGWHFKMGDVAFVEPQVEVMYGKVMGDNFKANNDVTIEQEDFETLITRAGVRSGFYFPENKGVIYVRASVLHDFKGEMESTARFEKAVNSVKDDIGGTWYEIGLGANFNMSPTSYIYVDLERTNGGAVVENWRYNLGFRKVF